MLNWIDWGTRSYGESLQEMQILHQRVVDGSIPDTVITVEHPPVVTMGLRNLQNDLIISPEILAQKGIEYFLIDRGGSATAHEPGQLVIYPLVNLANHHGGVKQFVWILEEVMLQLCARYQVIANRDPINPGIWVGQNKIGALGVRIKNRVSMHGLAFNAINNLETFKYIVPCGIIARNVTSLLNELNARESSLKSSQLNLTLLKEEVKKSLLEIFFTLFKSDFSFKDNKK